jgi:hypothetical protein
MQTTKPNNLFVANAAERISQQQATSNKQQATSNKQQATTKQPTTTNQQTTKQYSAIDLLDIQDSAQSFEQCRVQMWWSLTTVQGQYGWLGSNVCNAMHRFIP